MILTIDELRGLVDFPTGNDANDALQILADAAEAAIIRAAGAPDAVTELVDGGYPTLILSRPIGTLTTITEDLDGTPLVLAADDYRYLVSGYVLRRMLNGTNPRSTWGGVVQVLYTPADDAASRELVQAQLVKLFVSFHPNLTSQTIGDWSEQFASGEAGDFCYQRDALLATLGSGPGMVVI